MRESKFRVWDTDFNCYLKNKKGLVIFNPNDTQDFDDYMKGVASPKYLAIKQYEFEQFTGLFDKNGVEIYEGDIIKLWTVHCIEVRYWQSGFVLYGDDRFNSPLWKDNEEHYEVVGNTHDNPELLRG